jgi:N-acyl-L-amino-acid amidohydrolase
MKFLTFTLLVVNFIQSKQHVFNSTSNLVTKLQEFIRFNTVSEEHNYSRVSKWLQAYVKNVGLELKVSHVNPEKPIIIGTWKGSDPSLKSILINSHYDVVPANLKYWHTDPFSAELGYYKGEPIIYGRGSQDAKSLTIMQLEALRALKNQGFKPKRTIHITIVPDEEVYTPDGMEGFVKTPDFSALNVGAALDEGFLSEDNDFHLFYGERASWGINITASGNTGHSSKFIDNLAITKLHKFIQLAENYRTQEYKRSIAEGIGMTNTINLVMMGGGTANNVVPDTVWAYYNIRSSPTIGSENTAKLFNSWALETGVELDYVNFLEPTVSPHDKNAIFYNTVIKTTEELGYKVKTEVFAGGTDSRCLRDLNIPAYSITPCENVETLAHDHNEYLPVRCLQTGVMFYSKVLPKLTELDNL